METDKLTLMKDGPSPGLTETHVSSFLSHLRAEGYAERTLRNKRSVVTTFVRWALENQLAVDDLSQASLTTFVERYPQKTKARLQFELAALQPFLKYLHAEKKVSPRPPQIDTSLADCLENRYMEYLRNERGLAENSLRVYLPLIRDFLSDQVSKTGIASPESMDAGAIQNYLLERVPNRSGEYARLLATALRSFFRFLYIHGETVIDLSLSIPTVRRWCQTQVPTFLTPEEVERILSAIDLSTPSGRRDKAILLLLARLGLRAGEVVGLELEDILWRTGEIVVRGKGQQQDHLPLLFDVGEALALYISQDRGTSSSRRVFLRMHAPRVGLTGPAAIGHIVRRALARAGLRVTSRGAAHLFRHSLATTMIRHGASMAEIAEVLRHRSQSNIGIYAKVDFESLRDVSRSWPTNGDAQ